MEQWYEKMNCVGYEPEMRKTLVPNEKKNAQTKMCMAKESAGGFL